MRLWLVFAVAGGLAVTGAAVSATDVSLRCAAAAFAVLAWQAAMGARSAPPALRWLLTAGCVLFATAALVRDTAGQPDDVGWFAYGPPDTAALTSMLEIACRQLNSELAAAGVQLGAVVLLAGAVHHLPHANQRSRTVLTSAAAVVLVAWAAADRWLGIDLDRLVPVTKGVWPGLISLAAGVAGLVLAGRRADHRWLVAAGAALVATQTAVTLSDLTSRAVSVLAIWDLLCSDAFRAVAVSTAASASGGPDLGAALRTALLLGAPALLVIGALRVQPSAPEED